jgi:hypothetical protein
MSTPVEYMKLHGKMEALRAEHAEDKRRAIEQRDAAWRRRIKALEDEYRALAERHRRDRPAVAAAEREIAYLLSLIDDPFDSD